MKTYKFIDRDETRVAVIDEDGLTRVQTIPSQLPEGAVIAPFEGPSELEEWRESAVIDKASFLIKVKDAAILTKAEAKAAAKGEWPASFAAALTSMTAKEAEDAEITWAATRDVRRNSPLISYVQAVAGLTDIQVDDLFK